MRNLQNADAVLRVELDLSRRLSANSTRDPERRSWTASAKIMEEMLDAAGVRGTFHLRPVDKRRWSGRSALTRFPVSLGTVSQRAIKITVKPGDDGSVWDYWLVPQGGNLTAEWVLGRLQELHVEVPSKGVVQAAKMLDAVASGNGKVEEGEGGRPVFVTEKPEVVEEITGKNPQDPLELLQVKIAGLRNAKKRRDECAARVRQIEAEVEKIDREVARLQDTKRVLEDEIINLQEEQEKLAQADDQIAALKRLLFED